MVQLIGNITSTPEKKMFQKGSVVNFSVAVNKRYKNKDTGDVTDKATFINCEVWGKLGDIIFDYAYKGGKVYVQGELVIDEKKNPEGVKMTFVKVRVNEMSLLSRNPNGTQQGQTGGQSLDDTDEGLSAKKVSKRGQEGEVSIEDVPF